MKCLQFCNCQRNCASNEGFYLNYFALQTTTTFEFIFISDIIALEYICHISPYHIIFCGLRLTFVPVNSEQILFVLFGSIICLSKMPRGYGVPNSGLDNATFEF